MVPLASVSMAEAVRGGLQAIPSGQVEAAKALGLGYWQMMGLIVLPQALRIAIPAIVNTFIGFFKDTTLVSVPTRERFWPSNYGVRNSNPFELPEIDEAANYEFAMEGSHLRWVKARRVHCDYKMLQTMAFRPLQQWRRF